MNYLELVESFSFGLTASWKVQDEREEYIFFFFSCPAAFRDLSSGLSGTFQLCSKVHIPVRRILLKY